MGKSFCSENCPDIGRCCRKFCLEIPEMPPAQPSQKEELAIFIKSKGLPFVPLDYDKDEGWRFSCSALGEDGLCLIYENRPIICRRYQPGTDDLCCVRDERLVPMWLADKIREVTLKVWNIFFAQ